MDPREIPDIEEAEGLLKQAESAFPSEESARYFSEAFDRLNDFLEIADPEEPIRKFVENLKCSYTRTVLARIDAIKTEQIDTYIHYLILLSRGAKAEFREVRSKYPDLADAFDRTLARFRPQLQEILDAT